MQSSEKDETQGSGPHTSQLIPYEETASCSTRIISQLKAIGRKTVTAKTDLFGSGGFYAKQQINVKQLWTLFSE